jgi:hypothetical protein
MKPEKTVAAIRQNESGMKQMTSYQIIENIFEHNVNDRFFYVEEKMNLCLASTNNRIVPSSSSSQQQRQNGEKDKKTVKDVGGIILII